MAGTTLDRSRLDRCIAVTNGKGGVGKTTTTSHVAGLLALAGYPTLAVDLDPQGNLGDDLGYNNADLSDEGRALTRAVLDGEPPQVLENVRENLDVLPGGGELEELVGALAARRRSRGQAEVALSLARALAQTHRHYDFILIDSPPGEPELQELALAAARWVVIPYKSDASSRKGLRKVASRIQTAWEWNPTLELLAVFLYGTGKNYKAIRTGAQADIREDLGPDAPILDTVISHLEAVARNIRNNGQLAFELERDLQDAPKWYEQLRGGVPVQAGPATTSGNLAEDFRSLAQELFARLDEAEQPAVRA